MRAWILAAACVAAVAGCGPRAGDTMMLDGGGEPVRLYTAGVPALSVEVPEGTAVRLLEWKSGRSRVAVVEGEHQGEAGWVDNDRLRPASR